VRYINYKKAIKQFHISSIDFAKIIGVSEGTPSSNWKRKDNVPQTIEIILELLKELPIEKRLMFIHNKLEEREKG